MTIAGLADFILTANDISHIVYRKGKGPAVVLMHELPGMVPSCISLAEVIAAQGFTVFMPLMFGAPGDNAPLRFTFKLCISREFRIFSTGGKSPIVDWMRALCRKAHGECGGPGVGAIGMCLTGNFVISLMAGEDVIAPVTSQPSLPIGFSAEKRRSIGVPQEDVNGALRHATPLLGLRFSGDTFCQRERFDSIRAAFGPRFREIEIDSSPGNPHGIKRTAHSVLTLDLVDKEGHPTRAAREAVFAFLRERLVV